MALNPLLHMIQVPTSSMYHGQSVFSCTYHWKSLFASMFTRKAGMTLGLFHIMVTQIMILMQLILVGKEKFALVSSIVALTFFAMSLGHCWGGGVSKVTHFLGKNTWVISIDGPVGSGPLAG